MKKLTVPYYELGTKLTEEQLDLFDEQGVIIFRNFITKDRVAAIIAETQRIEKEWLDAGYEKMNGIPLKFGKDANGNKCIQRLCFLSQHRSGNRISSSCILSCSCPATMLAWPG